jgi:phosphoglycolate phosphatase-like HAD superfamily hydrolase
MVPSLSLHHSQILSDYPNLYGGPLEEFHDTIIIPHRPGLTEDEHERSTAEFIRFFLEEVKHSPPSPCFDDVLGALEGLKAKYPSLLFAVATTKPTKTAESDLTSSAVPDTLRSLLSHVQGTDAGISPKPAPDVLLRCASAIGVDIEKTIYVGDTSRDSGAGRAAGCMMTVTVQRDAGKLGDKLGAHEVISDFMGIEGAFNRWRVES